MTTTCVPLFLTRISGVMISTFNGSVDYAFLTWLAHFVDYWYFDAGHLLVCAEVHCYALLEIARNYYSNVIDLA